MKEEDVNDVIEQLTVLAPRPEDAPRPPAQALARLRGQLAQKEPAPLTRLQWRLSPMSNRKYAFAAVALLVVLAIAFSLPPVRAAAADFLGLFRVQNFAAVSVSPQQLALLEDLAEQGLYPGDVEMLQEPGEPETVAGLPEAEARLGRPVATAPELGPADGIRVADGGRGRLHVDLQSTRAILQAAGADPLLLPESLAGATVDVTLFPSVEQRWGDVSLVQTESPLVDYPDEVDPTVIGEALLRVLGMDPAEAQRLAAQIDWTSTMLLPIPEGLASFQAVRVDGQSGLALSSVDGRGSSLMWQAEGILYLLAGEQSVERLLAIAGTID